MPETPSAYDPVAAMYHELWADWYFPAARPALERLFFSVVPPQSRVLDLCCGSGHVTRELAARDYLVTGVDNSAELIALARQELPSLDFRVQDARSLTLDRKYDAVLSTFDSLNHILTIEDLESVFRCVYRALVPGGLFCFDMNLEEAYSLDLDEWSVDLKDSSVGLVRGSFDHVTKKASTELVWFMRDEDDHSCWRQQRSLVEQQCYSQTAILTALGAAGFRAIEALTARQAGVTSGLGFGRTYFRTHANESSVNG